MQATSGPAIYRSGKLLELEIQAAVEEFLNVHLLHWLEIMSLMGTVNHAAQLLLSAANWSKVSK